MKRFRTLIDALDAAPAERRFVTFWTDEDEHENVSFAEFRRRARVDAHLLHKHGVGDGDRVVIIMPQGIPAMTAFVGAMMLGAVPAILAYPNFKIEPSKYRSGLAGVTANLGSKAVLIDSEFPEEFLEYVCLEDSSHLLRAASSQEPSTIGDFSAPHVRANSLAFIQHSAGTTGLQKGVALTHKAVLTQLDHLACALQIDEASDRVYNWLPLYHDMGLIACFMLPMVCHLPVVMQSPLDWVMHPDSMLQVISDYKCTLAWLPNFAFQFVARRSPARQRGQYNLSSVRALINCSEPVRGSSFDEFKNALVSAGIRSQALHSSYAMAENVFAVTQSDVRREGPRRIWVHGPRFRNEHIIEFVSEHSPNAVCLTSSGRLLPGHQIRIISDTGAVLNPGNVGEILVQSDCLFDGYYNRPDLTAEVLIDGWYRTGDLGFMLDEELYVVGRKKDLLIIGGENIYPQDIEEIVSNHPAIQDGRAIAIGIYNPDLGTEEIVVVAEVKEPELLAHADRIERELRSQVVAGIGVAVRSIFLKPPRWLIKSTAGKPARSATREKLGHEHPELKLESLENA